MAGHYRSGEPIIMSFAGRGHALFWFDDPTGPNGQAAAILTVSGCSLRRWITYAARHAEPRSRSGTPSPGPTVSVVMRRGTKCIPAVCGCQGKEVSFSEKSRQIRHKFFQFIHSKQNERDGEILPQPAEVSFIDPRQYLERVTIMGRSVQGCWLPKASGARASLRMFLLLGLLVAAREPCGIPGHQWFCNRPGAGGPVGAG